MFPNLRQPYRLFMYVLLNYLYCIKVDVVINTFPFLISYIRFFATVQLQMSFGIYGEIPYSCTYIYSTLYKFRNTQGKYVIKSIF